MNIYPSTQVRPYVYMGIHKVTGQIYIGYREANIIPSHLDIFEYRTSSKIVNPNFSDYNWYIIAEFETGNDAYDFEQHLIFENWGNPLLLNGQYRLSSGKKRFKSNAAWNKGKVYSQPSALKNRPKTKDVCRLFDKKEMAISVFNRWLSNNEIELTSPTGEISVVIGLKNFCKANNLNTKGLTDVLKNRRTEFKGWTAKYL